MRLLEQVGDKAKIAQASLALGTLLTQRSRYDQAIAAIRDAATLYRRVGDQDGLAYAMASLAGVYAQMGKIQEGLACVSPLLTRLGEAKPPPIGARLYRTMLEICHTGGRFVDCLHYAAQLEDCGHAAQDERVVYEAKHYRANALYHLGDLPQALRIGKEVVTDTEAADDLVTLLYGLHLLSLICQAIGDFDQDAEWNARAKVVAERLGQPVPLIHTLSRTGKHALYTGDWGQARADFARAYALDQEIGVNFASPHALLDLGHLQLLIGHVEEGVQLLEQSVLLAEQWNDLQALRQAQQTLAEFALLEGRPEEARLRLVPLLDRSEQQETAVTRFLALLAWAYLDLDDLEQAARTLHAALERASEHSIRPVVADALRVKGVLEMRQERWQEAEACLEEALTVVRQIGMPYGEAKILYAYGLLHTATGKLRRAYACFEQALAICQRLGEGLHRFHIEQARARL